MLTAVRRRTSAVALEKDLRSAILAAARELFFKVGPEGVTARKISAKAGCSPTAIYLYYRNIDDVLHHLRMEGHALLARYMIGHRKKASVLAQIEAMGRAYFKFGIENPQFYDLMFLAKVSRNARRDEIRQEMLTLTSLRDAVVRGLENGEIRAGLEPTSTSNALWAQVHGVTSLAVQGLLSETAPARQSDVLETILEAAYGWLRP
jgi:AcrR family transcriptional regulator